MRAPPRRPLDFAAPAAAADAAAFDPRLRHRAWPDDEDDGPSVFDAHRAVVALRRWWWIPLLVPALTVSAATLWLRAQPQSYRARAVVQLVDRQELTQGLAGGAAERGITETAILSQIEILRSRAIAGPVVDSVPAGLRVRAAGFPSALLTDVAVSPDAEATSVPLAFAPDGVRAGTGATVPYGAPIAVDGVRFAVSAPPPGVASGVVTVVSRDRAVDLALRTLTVLPRRQTTLLDVVVTADEPEVASRVVNAWVQTYQTVDAQRGREQTRRRLTFIEDQLAVTDARLVEAERALSGFRTRQRAYSSQEKFRAQRAELAQLETQRQTLEAERRLAGGLLADIETGGATVQRRALNMLASSSVGATPVVSRLYTQLVDYEGQRGEATSGPAGKAATHRDVLRLDTLVADTRRQLTDAVRAHLALLDARVTGLDEQRRSGDASLDGSALAEAQETRLQQNVQVLRDQAALLRTEYQRVRISDAAAVGQVEIVDLAQGGAPIEIPRTRLLAFAVAGGLLVGVALAWLCELMDRSVRSRQSIEGDVGLPLLATIPPIQTTGTSMRLLPRAASFRREVDRRRSVALTAASETRAPSSEAFRQLRTNLAFVGGAHPLRTIVVTSAREGEGKTSVAVNLAISFSQQQRRVLLVDCDLLASGLHRVFALPAGPGLQQLVLQRAAPGDVVRTTAVPGLCVVTAGNAVDGTDVLGNPALAEALERLGEEFDVLVLDTPPVLAVSDTLLLGVAADGVVLVARAGDSRIGDVVEALRHLEAAGANVVGGILNDPRGRVPRYGGYYYPYGYGARYGGRYGARSAAPA